MSLYLAFELMVIALLLGLSLRLIWQRVLKPALQRPKAACSSGGCNSCSPKT
ncbi:MAG: hypothetical protein V4650_14960 [Pseudomonadota bacterium]